MPGEVILLNSIIKNLGVDCYIRAKITYKVNDTEYDERNYISGDYNNWNKVDDYYYYDSVLEKKDSLDLFDSIKIPKELENQSDNNQIIVDIKVEAIQAKHFDGNWENQEIINAIDRSYSIDPEGKSTIIFENNSEKYLDYIDNFFDNLGYLLPGDNISDQILINNKSNNRLKYYLTVDTSNLTEEENKLLDKVNLKIKNSNGTIKEEKITEIDEVLLGTYNSGTNEIIDFSISIPTSLNNEYSKIASKIIWIFSVEEEKRSINPETWDMRFDWSITLFFCSALGLLIVMILEKKENDIIENKNSKEKRKKI